MRTELIDTPRGHQRNGFLIRPRRYYQISDLGNRVLDELSQEWKSISSAVNGLLNNGD
jgi:DNA-binding PadR family transcriptional regulator